MSVSFSYVLNAIVSIIYINTESITLSIDTVITSIYGYVRIISTGYNLFHTKKKTKNKNTIFTLAKSSVKKKSLKLKT